MRLSLLRPLIELVDKAREEGPLRPWEKPQKPQVSNSLKNRLHYSASEFRQDPKVLWASEIAQSLAEGTIEALRCRHWRIALLRAKKAADYEAKFCARPGVYQELFLKVSELLEENRVTEP